MKAELWLDRNMRFIGKNEMGLETAFDTHPNVGGEDSAASPMEIALQALAACSAMDVVSIIRKKRKTITDFRVFMDAERGTEHPKIYTRVHLIYQLTSPDAELKDLERAVELSQTIYCAVSAIFKRSGCEVTYESKLVIEN